MGRQFPDLPRIAQTHPEAQLVAATLDGLIAMRAGDSARAPEVLRWVWTLGGTLEAHPFVVKYLSASHVTIGIATGVSASLPISRDAVGLALAELEQEAGQLDRAIKVVEQLDPSLVAAVSLSELYLAVGWHDNVVQVTNGITNTDDPTALIVTFRGVAFRELGHFTAAREAFKEALKSKARDASIRHMALAERAKVYIAEGKPAMAKKDLDRVLAENSNIPRSAICSLACDGRATSALPHFRGWRLALNARHDEQA